MDTNELRNYATVLAALVALCVFLFNSRLQRRNQRIENLARFFDVHQRLVAADGFLMRNHAALQAGSLRRDPDDMDEQRSFHLLLLQVEQLAILAANEAVPRSTQVYMFGQYARQLRGVLTDAERNSMFWDLAVEYLNQLSALTDEYESLSPEQRKQYHR